MRVWKGWAAEREPVRVPEQAGAVAAVAVTGNFIFDPATHRDFLGACLGTGVERGKVGDILLTGESGAQILVAADLVEHFERTLTQVLLFHSLISNPHPGPI